MFKIRAAAYVGLLFLDTSLALLSSNQARPQQQQQQPHPQLAPLYSTTVSSSSSSNMYEPLQRDATYGNNIAQYLLDLHDSEATFDFCGGMMFQLVLTDQLKDHLRNTATSIRTSTDDNSDLATQHQQPKVFDATKSRMFQIPEYSQNAKADNINVFHGRELRQIPHAKGGFGFVLQLSMAIPDGDDDSTDTDGNISAAAVTADPEGWSTEEIQTYDGWGHDSGRKWRKADEYEAEGVKDFKQKFGKQAFGLNHRFYLHLDGGKKMWLSAEDGCEGTPAVAKANNPLSRMLGL